MCFPLSIPKQRRSLDLTEDTPSPPPPSPPPTHTSRELPSLRTLEKRKMPCPDPFRA